MSSIVCWSNLQRIDGSLVANEAMNNLLSRSLTLSVTREDYPLLCPHHELSGLGMTKYCSREYQSVTKKSRVQMNTDHGRLIL